MCSTADHSLHSTALDRGHVLLHASAPVFVPLQPTLHTLPANGAVDHRERRGGRTERQRRTKAHTGISQSLLTASNTTTWLHHLLRTPTYNKAPKNSHPLRPFPKTENRPSVFRISWVPESTHVSYFNLSHFPPTAVKCRGRKLWGSHSLVIERLKSEPTLCCAVHTGCANSRCPHTFINFLPYGRVLAPLSNDAQLSQGLV